MLTKVLHSRLIQNVFSLYAGQAAIWTLPLITVPYLTRVLGVSEWGRYSVALSVSTQLALLVEYGFGITANRTVARLRTEPERIGATVGAVVIAKTMLAAAACLIATIEYALIPSFRQAPVLFWFAVAAGIAQGASFSWCLYGLEKISFAVALDLGSRALAAASLILVRNPRDSWKFFAVQMIANLVAMALGFSCVQRSSSVKRPEPGAVATMLRQGFGAMLSRPGFGIYTGLYTFLLGVFATSRVVGQYAGAERIGRAITALTVPLCLAIFPRVNYLLAADPSKLRRLRVLGGASSIAVGAAASLAAYVFAPAVTRGILGSGFDGSAEILRILSPLPLLAAINQILLYQYLFPEGAFNFAALSLAGTTLLVLLAAVALGLAGNANTIAALAVVAEVSATFVLLKRFTRVGARFALANNSSI